MKYKQSLLDFLAKYPEIAHLKDSFKSSIYAYKTALKLTEGSENNVVHAISCIAACSAIEGYTLTPEQAAELAKIHVLAASKAIKAEPQPKVSMPKSSAIRLSAALKGLCETIGCDKEAIFLAKEQSDSKEFCGFAFEKNAFPKLTLQDTGKVWVLNLV